MNLWIYGAGQDREGKKTTRTRTTRYITLLSVVLALALTVALAACGSDEPSGVTGPDRTASTLTETPVSPARTPSTPGSGDAPTATNTPEPPPATAPLAASGSVETDREALVALYNATDGENWNGSANWLSGEIPAELGSLSNLLVLDLNDNALSGEIPAELGSLPILRNLYLDSNDLSGCVPSSLEDQLNLDFSELGGLPFC